ncbi:hypothetical protein VB715_01605 [Crocosphaera sp. UHCC 0190]|uniref:hypothetical protein n=1 Tax=Crocosphaera sp. UHCC 0190 TaxID=3110246 RepID=UPI002B1F6147|nr:hypothetical protein [Crocosphaera sp. UHCC 0190]MEA5508451.1 hypothetical protein [Crocosphaera sp. UHCC 0190]
MEKILSIFGLMTACVVATPAMPIYAENLLISEAMLQQMTQELNQNLPMMINDLARWDSVSAGPGSLLNYNFTIVSANKPNANELKQLQMALVSNTCRDQSVGLLLENGVALSFNYRGNGGQSLANIRVNPADCGY